MNDEQTIQPTKERVALGSTELRISPLGIGTWQWGESFLWGYGKGYNEGDVHTAFQAALQAGINFFDTAEAYGRGRSEKLLGRFARHDKREAVIATKFAPLPWRLHQTDLLEALHKSLKRLGLRQVDLYQVHFPLPPVPIETWTVGLADAVWAGLARAVGISNCDTEQMQRAHKALDKRGVHLASNQVQYSLLDRSPERNGLLQACHELGVTLIAYSPLGQGVLTGKYTPENPPPGIRGLRYRQYLAEVQPLIALLRDIGQAHGGKTPAQVALNWVMCKGAVPIPGAKNIRHAQSSAGALGWSLNESEVAELDATSDVLH